MKQWYLYAKKADFNRIAEEFSIDPVTARIIRNRDIIRDEEIRKYLWGDERDLYDPALLSGAARAAGLIRDAAAGQQHIRILGDYDIDGICAVYILYDVLKRLGARVDYVIPDRLLDGYGIRPGMIEDAFAEGTDLIVTCDNGISACREIALAKKLGMKVIVTDHHQIPYEETEEGRVYEYPPADVIVNPQREGETYPFPGICGAVVAWKVAQLLDPKAKERYMDAAAFATVGDVMDLKDENRIIVKCGLRALMHTENTGFQSLIRRCGLEGRYLSPYHIGFVLGPCINATGRLASAKSAISLLTSSSPREARQITEELYLLNEKRKELTQTAFDEAVRLIEQSGLEYDRVFLVYLPGCHESIAGIVAGRIRERYEHPALVVTNSSQPGVLKGSGRSIEKYSMYDALAKCASLLTRFGGHPMAAGLSFPAENLEMLRKKLNEQCDLKEQDFCPKRMIDAPMPISYLTEKLVEEFGCLEPFGKGNERPLFAQKNLRVLSGRILGMNRNVLKMRVKSEEGTVMDAVCFQDVPRLLSDLALAFSDEAVGSMLAGRESGIRMDVLYEPDINEYNGMRTLQITIRDYKLDNVSRQE